MTLERSTLNHLPDQRRDDADVTLRLTQATLRALLLRTLTFPEALASGAVQLEGNPLKLQEFFGLFDELEANFPIVTPRSGTK